TAHCDPLAYAYAIVGVVRHVNPQLAIAAVPRIGRDKSDGVLLPELTADGCTVVPYRAPIANCSQVKGLCAGLIGQRFQRSHIHCVVISGHSCERAKAEAHTATRDIGI